MKIRSRVLILLVCSFMLLGSLCSSFPPVDAIGVANVIVTKVYWGTNELVPENVRPGDTNAQLSVVLSNVGDDTARSVTATLLLKPPLKYVYFQDGKEYTDTSVTKAAGDIKAVSQGGLPFTVVFTLSVDADAEEGVYHYDLQLSYKSARELREVNLTHPIDVPIWWGDLLVQEITTQPAKIFPGNKQVKVIVSIANSGTGIASNVRLWLELEPPFKASSSGSDAIFLGKLSSGETYPAEFIIDVLESAAFGRYSVSLTEERGKKHVPIGEVPLYVNEKVKFEIVNIEPSEAKVGETGLLIQVALKNKGSIKADSVRVQLQVGNFFSGTLTDFLGTMLAGDVKVAYFTVDIDAKAQPKEYVFDLRIDWTQEDNSLDDTLTISIDVQPPAVPVAPIALVIIAAIAVPGYLFYKRRKMRKTPK